MRKTQQVMILFIAVTSETRENTNSTSSSYFIDMSAVNILFFLKWTLPHCFGQNSTQSNLWKKNLQLNVLFQINDTAHFLMKDHLYQSSQIYILHGLEKSLMLKQLVGHAFTFIFTGMTALHNTKTPNLQRWMHIGGSLKMT